MIPSRFQSLWANNSTQDVDDWEAIRCHLRETQLSELSPGEVVIETHYSSLNYKDALAVTGSGKILRNLPLIPGIDVSGIISQSRSAKHKEGDAVIVHGCNTGEVNTGGYSEYVRVQEKNIIPLPKEMSLKESMIYGTAGFTAGLAIHQMEHNGLSPNKGKILVTGATGGVGSLAVTFLNKLGYETETWTRKDNLTTWLRDLGANDILDISTKDFKSPSLASPQWAGAIDNVGGDILSYILARINLTGSVASIGLAKSPKLIGTVFPFILRGINLLGISSNNCPRDLRLLIWQKLASQYKPDHLSKILSQEISLSEISQFAEKMIQGKTFGRTLVKVRN